MTAETLLARLDGVRQTGPGRWLARCPAHDDRHASLSVRELDDGRVLLNDFAGCCAADVLGAVGLDLGNLFPRGASGDFQRERRPWVAIDVLRACAHELLIAVLIIRRSVAACEADRARLLVAAERLQRAVDAVDAR